MTEMKFEKMALYRNKALLVRELGVKEFKKGIIEKIPGIAPLITERYKSMYGITYNISYDFYRKSIWFVCTNFATYQIKDDDISFKRKNNNYKTKINYEPFIKWYRYKFIIDLKEFIKENNNNYDPYLEKHISDILTKNRIDYINKIIYD